MQHYYECDMRNIHALIEQSGLSCEEIASRTGVSVGSLYKYRQYEKCSLSIRNAILLADFFAVPLDYLVGRCDRELADKILENYGQYFMELRRAPYEAYLIEQRKIDSDKTLAKPRIDSSWPYNIVSEVGADYHGAPKMRVDYIISPEHEQKIVEIIGLLEPHQVDCLLLRYRNGLTFREIGGRIGVTSERVRQISDRAIRILRRHPLRDCFLYGEEYFQRKNSLALREFELRRRQEELDAWEGELNARQNRLGTPNKLHW